MADPLGQGSGAIRATALMLVAVGCYSLIPLLIAVSQGGENPLLFVGLWRIGALGSYAVLMVVAYRPLLRADILGLVVGRLLTARYRWLVLFTILSTADYALFALSTKFIDIAITSVLFEAWPLITMVLLSRLYGRAIDRSVMALAVPCILGVAFVMASQSGGFRMLVEVVSTTPAYLMVGFLSALGAVVFTSLAVCGFKCGSMLQDDPVLIVAAREAGVTRRLDSFGAVLVFMVTNLVSVPLNLSLGSGLGFAGTLGLEIPVPLVVFGGVALAAGAVCWQMANAVSSNVGINAMGYLTPVFSLLLLWTFGKVGSVEPGYLIIGAAGIVSANLLINFEAESRFGFKSMLVALWACGAVVYVRGENFLWSGPGYFELLALSATVFTLILGFRVARLVSRTTYEDNASYGVFRSADSLVRRGVFPSEVRSELMRLDASQGPERLYPAYIALKRRIASARDAVLCRHDATQLDSLEASLDSLVHSKQQGNNFGEYFALIVFCMITVTTALLGVPEVTGWGGFLAELFAVPFSAAIIFLTFNVWDFHRDRIGTILKEDESYGGYGVEFWDSKNRALERWLSTGVGLAVMVAYGLLLWEKWMSGLSS